MENFFYSDRFYHNISELIDDLEMDDEQIECLSDNWQMEVELSDLKPIINIDAEELYDMIYHYYEDNFTEFYDQREEEETRKAIKESVDFDKLRELLPKAYYPNKQKEIITKADLISEL